MALSAPQLDQLRESVRTATGSYPSSAAHTAYSNVYEVGLDSLLFTAVLPDQYGDPQAKGILLGRWTPAMAARRLHLIPDLGFYYDHDALLYYCALAYLNNMPLALHGHTGVGKTELVRYFAALLGAPVYRMNLHGLSTTDDIIGKLLPVGAGKVGFQDGLVTAAVRQGGLLLLEEMNATGQEVWFALHGLLDGSRALVLVEKDNEVVVQHSACRIFSTFNPAEYPNLYPGTKELSAAYLRRWASVRVGFASQEVERAIVLAQLPGLRVRPVRRHPGDHARGGAGGAQAAGRPYPQFRVRDEHGCAGDLGVARPVRRARCRVPASPSTISRTRTSKPSSGTRSSPLSPTGTPGSSTRSEPGPDASSTGSSPTVKLSQEDAKLLAARLSALARTARIFGSAMSGVDVRVNWSLQPESEKVTWVEDDGGRRSVTIQLDLNRVIGLLRERDPRQEALYTDAFKAGFLHELGHILYSSGTRAYDQHSADPATEPHAGGPRLMRRPDVRGVLEAVWHTLEDARIERRLVGDFRGARRYLEGHPEQVAAVATEPPLPGDPGGRLAQLVALLFLQVWDEERRVDPSRVPAPTLAAAERLRDGLSRAVADDDGTALAGWVVADLLPEMEDFFDFGDEEETPPGQPGDEGPEAPPEDGAPQPRRRTKTGVGTSRRSPRTTLEPRTNRSPVRTDLTTPPSARPPR